ncbi:MAG: hypothetical protein ACE5OR_10515 [bacterium]
MGSINKFGLAVFLLVFGTVATSAGHFFLDVGSQNAESSAKTVEVRSEIMGESTGWSLLQEKCTRCHTLQRVFSKSRTSENWARLMAQMRSFLPGWISDGEAAQITIYLQTSVCVASDTTLGQ